MDSKKCTMCEVVKPLDNFAKQSNGVFGRTSACKPCRHQKYYKNNYDKDAHWERQIKRNFNMTPEDYQNMFDSQNGVCAACKKPTEGKLNIDHCHTTGKVRGLLCGPCNRGLGLLQDNPQTLANLITYLAQ